MTFVFTHKSIVGSSLVHLELVTFWMCFLCFMLQSINLQLRWWLQSLKCRQLQLGVMRCQCRQTVHSGCSQATHRRIVLNGLTLLVPRLTSLSGCIVKQRRQMLALTHISLAHRLTGRSGCIVLGCSRTPPIGSQQWVHRLTASNWHPVLRRPKRWESKRCLQMLLLKHKQILPPRWQFITHTYHYDASATLPMFSHSFGSSQKSLYNHYLPSFLTCTLWVAVLTTVLMLILCTYVLYMWC